MADVMERTAAEDTSSRPHTGRSIAGGSRPPTGQSMGGSRPTSSQSVDMGGGGTARSAPNQAEPKKKVKRILVRRKVEGSSMPEEAQARSPQKKTIVARRINPGQTIRVKGKDVTMPRLGAVSRPVIPESVAVHDQKGPPLDVDGNILEWGLLGTAEEFLAMEEEFEPESARGLQEMAASIKSKRKTGTMEIITPEDEMRIARKEEARRRYASLKQMTIEDRLKLTKDERSIQAWNRVNKQWDRFKTDLLRNFGKEPGELCMSRTENYRQKVEQYELLDKATPLHRKYGHNYWSMSLRGHYGIHYVAIGNAFSGLYCKISDSLANHHTVIRHTKRFERAVVM